MHNNIVMRARMNKYIRDFMTDRRFIEIETPILTAPTPEGARDYPGAKPRTQGAFYALPQSPQQMKQILMVAGFERYYQIARCFRDEDLRGNRQPEFTQLDIEISFAEEEDVGVDGAALHGHVQGVAAGPEAGDAVPAADIRRGDAALRQR